MENVVNETQAAVVAPQKEPSAAQTETVATSDGGSQSREENAAFRRMRLESESQQRMIEALQAENESFRMQEVTRQMQADLAQIREMDPSVEDLSMLGEDFARLIAAGIDAKTAYAAICHVKSSQTPPDVGAVDGHSSGEKDFYLPEEVDRLSERDLEDPKIWERVRASMTKWK